MQYKTFNLEIFYLEVDNCFSVFIITDLEVKSLVQCIIINFLSQEFYEDIITRISNFCYRVGKVLAKEFQFKENVTQEEDRMVDGAFHCIFHDNKSD